MEQAWQIADREGVPGPAATQPPYSLVHKEIVDDPDMQHLAAVRNVAIVASYTLAGGVLTGKYDKDPGTGPHPPVPERAISMITKDFVLYRHKSCIVPPAYDTSKPRPKRPPPPRTPRCWTPRRSSGSPSRAMRRT